MLGHLPVDTGRPATLDAGTSDRVRAMAPAGRDLLLLADDITMGALRPALQQAGVRGILASGWGGLEADDLTESILQINHAPHDWLFPRMAAVVHHGGAGTTAAGLRAGRPTVVCPFMGDQPFWGRRVADLSVGPEPIPRKELTANGLARAIETAVADQHMIQNAADLGDQIRAEDGVGTAVGVIEGLEEQTAALRASPSTP